MRSPLRLVLLLFAGAPVSSCLVDLDEPCGEGFVEGESGVCVCPAGQVAQDGDCVECDKHEVVRSGSCVCKQGYERSAGECKRGAPEAEASPDAGACDGGCGAEDQATGGDASSCESSAACEAPLLCDVYGSGECVEPPRGYGAPCESDQDCSAEARYCEIFSSRTCQIDACAEQGGVCPGDMVCCDYAIISRSLCIPAREIAEGACPAPGERVEREGDE